MVTEKQLEMYRLLKRGWCQNSYARNASGQPVPIDSPNAVCFCLVGAMSKVGMSNEEGDNLSFRIPPRFSSLFVFNDDHKQTQEGILEFVRKAFDIHES